MRARARAWRVRVRVYKLSRLIFYVMDKIPVYRNAVDAVVFIRLFMFRENFYSRALDDELQPFLERVLESLSRFSSERPSESDKK